MAKRNISVSEIEAMIAAEGLGYAILHGFDSSKIVDQDLADMWEQAETLLAEIADYVHDNSDDVVDDNGDDEDHDDSYDEYN